MTPCSSDELHALQFEGIPQGTSLISLTADFQDLVLEQLRAIRTDVFVIKERFGRVALGISTLGQQVGALTTAVHSGGSEFDSFRRRIERIERRLELSDT